MTKRRVPVFRDGGLTVEDMVLSLKNGEQFAVADDRRLDRLNREARTQGVSPVELARDQARDALDLFRLAGEADRWEDSAYLTREIIEAIEDSTRVEGGSGPCTPRACAFADWLTGEIADCDVHDWGVNGLADVLRALADFYAAREP